MKRASINKRVSMFAIIVIIILSMDLNDRLDDRAQIVFKQTMAFPVTLADSPWI